MAIILRSEIIYEAWKDEGIGCAVWGLESLAGRVSLNKLTFLCDGGIFLPIET